MDVKLEEPRYVWDCPACGCGSNNASYVRCIACDEPRTVDLYLWVERPGMAPIFTISDEQVPLAELPRRRCDIIERELRLPCRHERVIEFSAKCSDACWVRYPGEANFHEGYVPSGIGFGPGGDYVEIKVCVACKVVVGFPPSSGTETASGRCPAYRAGHP